MRYTQPRITVVPEDWRHKMTMRAESRKLLKKGMIFKKPCQICLSTDSKMTHVNYESPYNVTWLCKKHYLLFQKERKECSN